MRKTKTMKRKRTRRRTRSKSKSRRPQYRHQCGGGVTFAEPKPTQSTAETVGIKEPNLLSIKPDEIVIPRGTSFSAELLRILVEKGHVSTGICIPDDVIQRQTVLHGCSIYHDTVRQELKVTASLPDTIRNCSRRFVIVTVVIRFPSGLHQELVLIDTLKREIERFDPHGGISELQQELDKIFNTIFHLLLLTPPPAQIMLTPPPSMLTPQPPMFHPDFFRFVPLMDFCPSFGPQIAELELAHYPLLRNVKGLCNSWTWLYAHLRLLNPEVDRQHIIAFFMEKSPFERIRYMFRYIAWAKQHEPRSVLRFKPLGVMEPAKLIFDTSRVPPSMRFQEPEKIYWILESQSIKSPSLSSFDVISVSNAPTWRYHPLWI